MNLPDPKVGCHKTGFTKKCRKLVSDGICDRWMHIIGMNPNTGVQVDQYRCIDDWVPLLLIENSKLQRETGAAVESFRNLIARQNEESYKQITDTGNDYNIHRALPVRSP
jgi:hypothetical protein